MIGLFDDRSSYDPAKDAVERLTVTIECHPGQTVHVVEYLLGLGAKAGLYHVSFNSEVIEPAVAAPAEPTPMTSAEAPASAPAAAEPIEGEAHGEQLLQHANPQSQAA